ncbi:MAG: sodium:panthothenate symporter [Lentisphaeria bacterium]|nr:sodium:panthothenate symporter [Lentisphaeria bacterium]
MNWYNWLIVIIPFAFVLYMAYHVRRYARGVSDFLAGGRLCGRYLISVGDMANSLSIVAIVAYVEANYRTGFSTNFWGGVILPISLMLSLTGYCTYRLRETKALSMGQFLEMRYNRSFRLFCAFLRTGVELLSNAIIPAISARFFIYLLGIPHYITIGSWRIQTLALVIGIVLLLAMFILLMGGTLSLVITDTFQGLMTYPIIFIFTMFIVLKFSWWDELIPVMADRVPGESFLNPYDIKSLRDFNLFAVVVTWLDTVLNRAVWFGGGASSAARSAHEQKMAGVLGAWRNGFSPLFYLLLTAMLLTVMNHVNYSAQARDIRIDMCTQISNEIVHDPAVRNELISNVTAIAEQRHIIGQDEPLSEKQNLDTPYMQKAHETLQQLPGGNAKFQEFRTLYNQLRLPVTIRNILPGFMLGLFILLMLMLMVSTDDSYIFSSAMTIVQDIIVPLRKTPLTPEKQILLIRILTVLTCVFFYFAALFMTQLDYIRLYTIIVTAIWVGGAGVVMLGGLYTRFGTTAGAYASIITGAFISGGGLLVQRNWADHIYPFLERAGLVETIAKILESCSGPFEPWIVWRMSAVKFPINSNEIMFMSMMLSIIMYCLVSLFTCRKPFNLERMLHRGKYAVDGEVKTFEKLTFRNIFKKLIGITPDYTTGDRIIAWGTFIYSFVITFLLLFVGTVIWNAITPWPADWWGWRVYITSIVIGGAVACISMVWFMIGGITDMRQMFRDLKARKSINILDNGMVEGQDSLADKAALDKVETESEKGQ